MAVVGSGHSLGGFAGGNVTARLLVVVSGNTAQLQQALAGATGSMETFNSGATRLGNALIRNVTLPLLGIGAGAVKLATDFQAAIARVVGLTPILEDLKAAGIETGDGMDYLSKRILAIAADPRVIASPRSLADSLYFAGSAGLSASEAFQVVELSAKGASVGMGQASDISKVLIFALNSFRGQGLTAASAMDTLTVAIKEGTAEPDELAIALGRLLPVARQVGLSFDEVVGSVAALTNIGLPTRVAVTSLRALFTELLAPTKQANDQLRALGLTAQEVRDAVAAGPVVAMNLLINATHGNIDALHQVVPQIRGFTALLGLTGDQAQHVTDIYNATKNSVGALGHALEVMSRTTAFKFQKALQELQRAGIELGQQLIPAFQGIFGAVRDLAQMFTALPDGMKGVVAGALLIAASMGPMVKLWGALNFEGQGLFGTFKSVGTGLGLLAVTAAVALAAFSDLAAGNVSLKSTLLLAGSAFIATTLALRGLQQLVNTGIVGTNALTVAFASAGAGAVGLAAVGIAALITAIAYFSGKAREGQVQAARLKEQIVGLGAESVLSAANIERITGATGTVGAAFRKVVEAAGALDKPLGQGLSLSLTQFNKTTLESVQRAQALAQQFGETGAAGALTPYIHALQAAQGTQKSANTVFREAGLSQQALFAILEKNFGAYVGTGRAIKDYVLASDAAAGATREVAAITQAQLTLNAANRTSVDKLAKTFGTSSDFIQSKIQDQGVSAAGLTDTVTGELNAQGEQWAKQAGLIDQTTGEIIAHEAELAAKEVELQQKRRDELLKTLNLFDEMPKKLDASRSKILKNAADITRVWTTEAANVQRLLARGLDPSVLQFLVDQGPQFVAKFVNASDKELGKLEHLFQLRMAAQDAVVLQEGQHMEGKAYDMIGNFAAALEANKNLPVGAVQKIMGLIIAAIDKKKIKQQGLDVISSFTAALTGPGALNMTGGAAGRVFDEFVRQFVSGKLYAKGAQSVADFANGLIDSKKLPAAKAAEVANEAAKSFGLPATFVSRQGKVVVEHYRKGIESKKKAAQDAAASVGAAAVGSLKAAGAFSAGQQVGSDFAAGLHAALPFIQSAAQNAAGFVKSIFKNSLINSPRLFTYYLGQDLIKEMGEGLKQAQRASVTRPTIDAPGGGWGTQGHSHDGMRVEGKFAMDENGDAYLRGVVVEGIDRYDRKSTARGRMKRGGG